MAQHPFHIYLGKNGILSTDALIDVGFLRQALKNAGQENADFDNLIIYVAKDCTSKYIS